MNLPKCPSCRGETEFIADQKCQCYHCGYIWSLPKTQRLDDCKHGEIVQIGLTTYRLYRLEVFADGILGTMTRFARLQPCNKRESGWWDDHNQKSLYRNWSDPCELVDDANTAVAGQRLIINH